MVVKKGMAIKVNKLQKQQFDFGIVFISLPGSFKLFSRMIAVHWGKKVRQQKECHTTWQPRIRCHRWIITGLSIFEHASLSVWSVHVRVLCLRG